MQLTVTTGGDDMFQVDVSGEIEVENMKALLESESGVPAAEITLYLDGKLLHDDKKSLDSFGVKNGDVLLLVRRGGMPSASTSAGGGGRVGPQQRAPVPMQTGTQGKSGLEIKRRRFLLLGIEYEVVKSCLMLENRGCPISPPSRYLWWDAILKIIGEQ